MSSLIKRTILSASRSRVCNAKLQCRTFPSLIRRTMADMSPVFTDKAMTPAGPYSQAIKTPHAIYCSGQIPADISGNLIQGTITQKTAQIFTNLKAVLEEAGSSLSKVVKVNVFLIDAGDFAEMNREYEKWVGHGPARSCVVVRGIPKGASLEIECIALP